METYKTRNGLKLEYEVLGEGEPLVFLHGLGATVKQIEKMYEPREGVKLILLNQQGHGNSEKDYDHLSFDVMGDDVIDLLDYLKIDSAYFAGISMGSAVCLNIATRYSNRVKKVMFIRNAWIEEPIRKEIRDAYVDMAEGLKNNDIELFKKSKGYEFVKEPSAYTRNNFLTPFNEEPNVRNYDKYIVIPKMIPIKSLDDLNKLTMPVMIVACKDDLCHPYELGTRMHELVKHSEFIEVPNKDTDVPLHNKIINEKLREMIEL